MTADQVIDLRKVWGRYSYAPLLPEATVLAERDWLAYVQAMAAAVPEDELLSFPSETEAAWAWPEGVAIVFDEPLLLRHTIVSHESRLGVVERVDAHFEEQATAGVVFGAPRLTPVQSREGDEIPGKVSAYPVIWVGVRPEDVISAYWLPDTFMHASSTGTMSQSTRLLYATIVALGHRLTRISDPATVGRGERRRIQRELPSLRALRLSSGATVSRTAEASSVEWTKRWMVRGHWRLQPHGPRRSLRRAQWIDPFVKGPEDKPLDVRPTVWRADRRPAEETT